MAATVEPRPPLTLNVKNSMRLHVAKMQAYQLEPGREEWLSANDLDRRSLVMSIMMVHDGNCTLQAFMYTYLLCTGKRIVVLKLPNAEPHKAQQLVISPAWYADHKQVFKDIRTIAVTFWQQTRDMMTEHPEFAKATFRVLWNDVEAGEPDFEAPTPKDFEMWRHINSLSHMHASGFNRLFWEAMGVNMHYAVATGRREKPSDKPFFLLKLSDSVNNGSCINRQGALRILPVHHSRAMYDIFIDR